MFPRLVTSTRRGVIRSGAAVNGLTYSSHQRQRPNIQLARAATTRARSKSATKSVISFDDLPSHKVDSEGNVVGPLEAYLDVAPKRKKRASTAPPELPIAINPERDEEAEYRAAVASGTIPETPLARLVWENWKRFPDCVLLTQVGNFFESYFEPAIELSRILGIKLTSKRYKSGQFPFTGFPIHQRDKYLKLLVQDLGYTVALVEEEHDPLKERNPLSEINRKVARIITPGTLVDESWVSGNESRYLLAIALGDTPASSRTRKKGAESSEDEPKPLYLAYADVSTGEFFTKEATSADIEDELARIAPREVVLDARLREAWRGDSEGDVDPESGDLLSLLRVLGVHVSFAEAASVQPTSEGVRRRSPAPSSASLERAAIALLRRHLEYALRDSMPTMPEQPDEFSRESASEQMHIDAATLQALEIRHALRPGGLVPTGGTLASSPLSVKGTLLSVLSRTVTDSGHRLLKRTLTAPSTSLPIINARLSLVAALVEREPLRTDLRTALRGLSDVMRLVQRFRTRRGDGSDVWDVARWIRGVDKLLERIRLEIAIETSAKKRKRGRKSAQLQGEQVEGIERLEEVVTAFAPLSDAADMIESAIDEAALPRLQMSDEDAAGAEEAGDAMADPTPAPRDARAEGERRREDKEKQRWWIRPSFSSELSELHERIQVLAERRSRLQEKLRETLGASSLSLTTNQRGAFVVSVKKKTELGRLERSDRFHAISETRSAKTFAHGEWSALGAEMERAHEQLEVAQARALVRLRAIVVERAKTVQRNAELVDEIDLAAGFAQVATELRYVRPVVHEGTELRIVNGRHPSVEAGLLASARMFTPNSTEMTLGEHLHVITGPNQGGKSTLLRQTAVIAILAQAGSYVPAEHAEVGVVDRVFSRIGARDDLFRDRSTFMLEMVETAAILRHATPRSLVIMDEIGRGTTLNAGVAIAYATLDYILKHIRCRTLFATHYHELARMLAAEPSTLDADGHAALATSTASVVTPPAPRSGVSFWCTDVDEMDGSFAYSYSLRPGINYNSHAIKAAQLAGMPESFLETAESTLQALNDVPVPAPDVA